MPAPALALMTRSLREDVRLFRPHFLRFLFVVFIFAAMTVAHVTSTAFGAPGLQFFRSISLLNFAFITLAAVSYFATAVTEEKEEQTLGLLKMAGIGSFGLLLGKAVPRMLATAVVLGAQVPFTLLAVTLGGVTLDQVVATYLALLAYMTFCASLGLLCSVYCRTSGGASMLTALVLLLLFALPPVIELAVASGVLAGAGTLAAMIDGTEPMRETLIEASPWVRLQNILATSFAGDVWAFQAASHFAVAGLLFAISCIVFEPLTRDGDARWRVALRSRIGNRIPVRNRPSKRAGGSGFAWKEFHFGAGGLKGLTLRQLVYAALAVAAGAFALQFGGALPGTLGATLGDAGALIALAALVGAAIESAAHAARILRDEVRQGTLPTIILTPHAPGEIIRAKLRGGAAILAPAALVLAIAACISPQGVGILAERYLMTRAGWLMFVQLLLLLDLTAYLSLVVRWGALPLAIGLVYVVVPGIGYLLLTPIAASTGTYGSALVVWELVCFPLDVLAGAIILLLMPAIRRRLLALAGQ